ncbi:MAG: hypothetical protein NT022_13040 [Deltaproteobacteria bacterium]|nr:hypothetical protein [Deltaproteobacteria bacterium]
MIWPFDWLRANGVSLGMLWSIAVVTLPEEGSPRYAGSRDCHVARQRRVRPYGFIATKRRLLLRGHGMIEGPARCAPTEVDNPRGGSRIAPTRDLGGIFAGTT